jgi:hypothetical protein
MADKEKMISVVKKVLAKASNNPSAIEAADAALKAQELMAKYHIEDIDLMDKVELEEISESVYHFKENDPNNHKWKLQLSSIVARNFRCEVYCTGKHIIKFFGYQQDTEIAKEVFGTLYSIGDRLGSKEFKKSVIETGTGKGVYNSFIAGFLKGIREALDKQCTALMLVVPKEVKEEYQELAKTFTKSFDTSLSHKNGFSAAHYQKGVVEGRNAISARQLQEKN